MPRINTEYRETAKKKIVAAALEIVSEKGWDAMTLEAIAQRVGVTKGALYLYFENSETLGQEVILEIVRKFCNNLLTNFSGSTDIHAILERLADFIFLQQSSVVPVSRVLFSIPKDTEFQGKVIALIDEDVALFGETLSQLQAAGQIPREVNTNAAVWAIYALTMGMRLFTYTVGKNADESKEIWIESAKRILMMAPRREND